MRLGFKSAAVFFYAMLALLMIQFSGLAKAENVSKMPASNVLPPLPKGVTELKFSDFFKLPIGPKGLDPTEILSRLDGKQVRVVGFQVKEEEPFKGLFMLTANPTSLAEVEDGPADDLPAATLFVHMPDRDKDKVIAYRSGLWALTGTLSLGNQSELNGRTSYVRLILSADPEGSVTGKKPKSH